MLPAGQFGGCGAAAFGGGQARDFSKEVGYIYRKQIEEAEMLVINKTDLLTSAQMDKLTAKLRADYSGRRVFAVSAHTGAGLEEWFEAVLAERSAPKDLMDVDYQRYGEGEALLGWLNATVRIAAGRGGVDGAEILHSLVHAVMEGLEGMGAEVAHLKMSVQEESGAMLRVQVTRNEEKPVFAGGLGGAVRNGELLINLRAEADPDRLAKTVSAALAGTLKDVRHEVTEFASFKPGQPVPTHRVEALA